MRERLTTNSARPAVDGELIVSDTPFVQCNAVVASADMNATVTFATGRVVAGYPMQKGYNPIQLTNVVFAAGTLVALYN